MAHSHTHRRVQVQIPLPGDSPRLQLYDVESSHWIKTGTDTLPQLATVPISGTGTRPRKSSPCM